MVKIVHILYCKLNRFADKFDCGIFTNREEAETAMDELKKEMDVYKIWIKSFDLTKSGNLLKPLPRLVEGVVSHTNYERGGE